MAYLKKIKDMGSAKSDDPNASEPSIRFKPNVSSSIEVGTPSGIPQGYKSNHAQVTLGRYAVVLDYLNWEAGSCLDLSIPQLALYSTCAGAQDGFGGRCAQLSVAVRNECVMVTKMNESHWGLSGYTTYCILFEANDALGVKAWHGLLGSGDGADLSKLVKCFEAFEFRPTGGACFVRIPLELKDVEDNLLDLFCE